MATSTTIGTTTVTATRTVAVPIRRPRADGVPGTMAIALVTGVTGQLGYYVAERLAKRGDTVWGLVRQSTVGRLSGEAALPYRPITGDLLDEYSLLSILEQVRPDQIFNFGAQSFIPSSWTQPILTAQYTGLGVVRLLEAIRRAAPTCRL